jgi:signal transduction histidine kinase
MDGLVKSLFTKGVQSYKNRTAGERVSIIYRFSSWMLTSLFYLVGNAEGSIVHQIGIIVGLFIVSCIMMRCYMKYSANPDKLRIIILIEMLYISCLLVPSGGLESPFIWYALNAVLAAAYFLAPYFCWLNMFLYVTSALLVSFTLFNEKGHSFFRVTYENLYIILAFSLVVLAVQLLSTLAAEHKRQEEELRRQGMELMEANKKASELGNHIMSLYKVIEAFNIQSSPHKLPDTIAEYAAKLSGTDISFFWVKPTVEYESSINIKNPGNAHIADKINKDIGQAWQDIRRSAGVIRISAGGHDFLAVTVKSNSRLYGLIGIECKSIESSGVMEFVSGKLLSFLSELSAVVFERIKLEEVSDHLMIAEEQNRIANEIHDSVSQRIFGIICAAHSISLKCGSMGVNELQNQMESVKDSASIAMKELRSSIYSLSSRKNGDRALSSSIREYADGISKLYGIEVDMDISGDGEAILLSLQKALYRIICEATGNAARHSMCRSIKIALDFQPLMTRLTIKDDGRGFYLDAIKADNGGLGLYNMKALVQSFRGQFKIYTEIGGGTEIDIVIPKIYMHGEQGGIAQ